MVKAPTLTVIFILIWPLIYTVVVSWSFMVFPSVKVPPLPLTDFPIRLGHSVLLGLPLSANCHQEWSVLNSHLWICLNFAPHGYPSAYNLWKGTKIINTFPSTSLATWATKSLKTINSDLTLGSPFWCDPTINESLLQYTFYFLSSLFCSLHKIIEASTLT